MQWCGIFHVFYFLMRKRKSTFPKKAYNKGVGNKNKDPFEKKNNLEKNGDYYESFVDRELLECYRGLLNDFTLLW